MIRNGKKVWTYTHAWREVARQNWGAVSVLASCENLTQVRIAQKKGYAAALVVSEFKQNTSYDLGRGVVGIPCPQQTGKAKDCVSCRLCMNDKKLGNRVIMFAVHGIMKKQAAKNVEL